MASFFRGKLEIFENWNSRFHAEDEYAKRNADKLSGLPADGIDGYETKVEVKRRIGLQLYRDFRSRNIHPIVSGLATLLTKADNTFSPDNIREILYANFDKVSAYCKEKIIEAEVTGV